MNKKQKTPKKVCTNSINGTPPAPPAPTSQHQLNHQTNKSDEVIKKQQKIIEELMEKVGHLEGTVSALEGKHSSLASTR